MTLLLQYRIYRADLRANPGVLYVFGDNEFRTGFGGQAGEMRGEPNAVGIATLKAPGQFWSDDQFAGNRYIIDALRNGETIVFPLDGVGTGLARLEQSAPETFKHLQRRIAELKSTTEQF